MGKIKNMLSSIWSSIKQTYNKFPLTIITVYILTLIIIIGVDFIIPDEILTDILTIISISGIGIFFTETLTNEKNKKIIGVIVSVLIGIAFDFVLAEITTEESFYVRLLSAYILIVPLLSIYNLIRKSGVKFEEYVIKFFSNFCKNLITYIILNIGISIVMAIFIILILDGDHWSILLRMLGAVLGFYYIPSIISSLSNMEVEVGKFIRGLIFYVFTPLISILIGIIYIYLIKISISGELLNKALFFILALIFTVAFPIVLMLKNYQENKVIKKILNIITYSYIPLIFLEIYSMAIRVSDYGLTPSRYMAYMLVFFEIAFLLLLVIKQSKYIKESIIVAVALIFIGTVTPLNVEEVSYRSQASRIKNILSNQSFDELSDEDKGKCYGAYKYLKRDDKEDYIDLSEAEIEKIISYNNSINKYDYSNEKYVYCRKEFDEVDISEYSKIYRINNYRNKSLEDNIIESLNGKIEVKVDFEEYIKSIIKANKIDSIESDKLFEENNILETNNGEFDIYLTTLTLRYDAVKNEIISFNLDGYLLKK